MSFNIAIIGAGVAGLSAAIALARDGHIVHVYERRRDTNEDSGSGVQIQPTGVQILRQWGLIEGLSKIAHENGEVKLFRYDTAELIGVQTRRGARGQWYCMRNAFRRFLCENAIASGAKIHFEKQAVSVVLETPVVTFADGSVATADLVIGSDGSNSVLRLALHPGTKRTIRNDCVLQAIIPREVMYKDEVTRKMYDVPALQSWLGPGAFSVASTMPHQEVFDAQVIWVGFADTDDTNAKTLLEPLPDYEVFRERIAGWHPSFRKLIDGGRTYLKWRIVESPHLPTWISANGRVALIGDSSHSMTPHAGEGSSMGLEDAAVLALLLRRASTVNDIGQYMSIFDKIRRERVTAIRKYSDFVGEMFTYPDGYKQQKRDAQMRVFDPNKVPDARSNINARYGTPEWVTWQNVFDAETAVREAVESIYTEKSVL